MRRQASTYVCLLTPGGRSAIASVRIEGPDAARIVDAHFHSRNGRPVEKQPTNRPIFGHWGGEEGEEVVLWVRRHHEIEVHCHGGPAVVEWILEGVETAGGRRRSFEDWVVAHEPPPLRAAARRALAQTITLRAAGVLLDQYQGALETELTAMVDLLSGLGACHDDASGAPERDASDRIDRLLSRAPLGLHLTRPWKVVLGGRPNVGKSSLVNALVGYERAIVYHQPGTTRDVVTAATALDGWPALLADTAGLREHADPIEATGIKQAVQSFREADLRVLVLNRSRPLTRDDRALISQWPDAMLVANQCDLPDRTQGALPKDALAVSAKTGEGVDRLAPELGQRLVPDPPPPGSPVPFCPDQVERLERARQLLSGGQAVRAGSVLRELLQTNRNKHCCPESGL